MANEFKVRKGLVVNGSGSVILDIQGSQGQLFSVTDQLSGSLFAVSDISGIPVMEAFSDNTIRIGRYGFEAIKVSGSVASVTGSFTGSFTGSLFGTASQALTASFLLGGGGGSGAGFPFTGSASITGSFRVSGSTNISASSYALQILGSGSSVFSVDGTVGRLFEVDDSLSGSLFSVNTAAGLPIIEAFSDNTVRIGQFGQRALFVSQSRVGIGTEAPVTTLDVSGSVRITNGLSLTGSLSSASPISASAILTTGAITAQTLVVQTITSSVSFVTGSTRFGSLLTNTHDFTGSVNITGSLTVSTTGTEFQVTSNGVVIGNLLTDNHSVTGSLRITGSIIQSGANTTSSFTGNVGIGTTSAVQKLHVEGSSAIGTTGTEDILIIGRALSGGVSFQQAASLKLGRYQNAGGAYESYTRLDIALRDNSAASNYNTNTTVMTLTNAGRVGIGTTAPDTRLHLYDGTNPLSLKIQRTTVPVFLSDVQTAGTTAGASWSHNIENTSNGSFTWSGLTNTSYAGSAILLNSDTGTSYITLHTANAANTAPTERMRITGAGNVGIGTTSPTTYSLAGRHFELNDAGGGYSFYHCNTTTVKSFLASNEADLLTALFTFSNHALTLGTNNTERMRITSGGNVLIGTGTNTGDKLQINGELLSTGSVAGYSYASRSNGDRYTMYGTGGLTYFYFGGNIAQINMSTGTYTALSDINKKKDFEPSTIGLNEILQLKPTLYRIKTDDTKDNKELGFIAQEVKEHIPQAYVQSGEGKDTFIGLNYNAIVASLVKAVQELKAELDELKNK